MEVPSRLTVADSQRSDQRTGAEHSLPDGADAGTRLLELASQYVSFLADESRQLHALQERIAASADRLDNLQAVWAETHYELALLRTRVEKLERG